MNWTQAICVTDWQTRNPGREPVVINGKFSETCCYCGEKTLSGIYIRIDPDTVPHPQ